MANITSQAVWNNQYEGGNTLFIEDTDATGLVVTANNVDITATEGSIVQCRNLGLSRAAPNSSLNMNRCTVFLRDQGGAGSGDLASGHLGITNSIITYSRAGGTGFEWPGFTSGATDRPTLDLSNTFITTAPEDGPLGTGQTFRMNFQGLAGAGHDFTNTIFGPNIAITFFPTSIPWVGVTFSDTTQTIVGVTQYARFDGGASNFGRITARWEGFFGCDFTNWDNPSTGQNADMGLLTQGNGQAGGGWKPGDANTSTTNRGHIYLFDNDYARDDFTMRSRSNLSVPHIRIIKGVSWFPQIRNLNTLTPVTDGVVDIGGFSYLETQTAEDRSMLLNEVDAVGGNNYIEVDADFNGMVFLEDEVVQNATLANSVSVDTNQSRPANLNYWSYLLDTFQTDGAAGIIQNTEASSWAAPCVLETTARQNIDVAPDTRLNGRTQAEAENLATNGITDALDVYPAMKARGVANRQSQNFLHTVTNGGYDSGARGFRFAGGSGNTRSDHATLYIIRTPANATVTGRFTSGGIIGVNEGSLASSATFVAAGDIDLGGIALMDGAVLTSGGQIGNLPVARNTAFTITDNNTIRYNFDTDTVINFATAYPNATFGTGITITNAGTGTLTVRGVPDGAIAGTNVEFVTSITFTDGAGATGTTSYLQLYPLTGSNTEAAADAEDILVAGGRGATYPFVADSAAFTEIAPGARFVAVWTRPGYNEVRQIIGPLVTGDVIVPITQTRNILANLTTDPVPNFAVDAIYDETNNRIDYFFTQGSGAATSVQTNYLFEQMKSTEGVGEYIAKNPAHDEDLITHTSNTATAVRFGTYQLRRGASAPNLQQTIAFVSVSDPDSMAAMDGTGDQEGAAASVIETEAITVDSDSSMSTLPTVVVGPEVTAITYGEVDGIVTANRTLQNTEIESIIDTELNEGTLTAIGRS